MSRAVIALLCGLAALVTDAGAAEVESVYTPFDLAACRMLVPPDEHVFEGAWQCTGHAGHDIFYAAADARSFVSFGQDGLSHCAGRITFHSFNTALSPVEWRVRAGKPFAAIERWSLTDGEGKRTTWLVVNALVPGDSCHAVYVAGSYPQANAMARRAADEIAAGFDCSRDAPEVVSTVGPPPIDLVGCQGERAD